MEPKKGEQACGGSMESQTKLTDLQLSKKEEEIPQYFASFRKFSGFGIGVCYSAYGRLPKRFSHRDTKHLRKLVIISCDGQWNYYITNYGWRVIDCIENGWEVINSL